MANYELATIPPKKDFDPETGFLFGADSQGNGTPVPYDGRGILMARNISGLAAVGGAYTLDQLPDASTVCGGSIRYAEDARRAGEGPGEGTGCMVWSDLTDWRTFYDNTVAAV